MDVTSSGKNASGEGVVVRTESRVGWMVVVEGRRVRVGGRFPMNGRAEGRVRIVYPRMVGVVVVVVGGTMRVLADMALALGVPLFLTPSGVDVDGPVVTSSITGTMN